MMVGKTVLVALVAFNIGHAGAAAQTAETPTDRFRDADYNRDGVTTRSEWQSYRVFQFDRIDRNHDGFVSRSDVPGFMKGSDRAARLDRTVKALDANGDEKLSRDEFVSAPALGFDRYDLNKNGQIEALELQAQP